MNSRAMLSTLDLTAGWIKRGAAIRYKRHWLQAPLVTSATLISHSSSNNGQFIESERRELMNLSEQGTYS